ncbi:Detected protein of confused Function [Hibiscus syriacus]|uniref:Detected protein of confused Function n=1 Tax=Hibiscus syriacus TaxID=106335 RepID=A0A6A2XX72_HIBSY|nr:Detected protein of confused Function [Hibiscus syriacus]
MPPPMETRRTPSDSERHKEHDGAGAFRYNWFTGFCSRVEYEHDGGFNFTIGSRTASESGLKDKKDKVSERIVTMQQLISLYGKTDTTSVLLEAMEYIRFLHEQVKVLSALYLQTGLINNMQASIKPNQDVEHYSLRSQGICLVPISYTAGVARSNGVDIWAPIKTTSPKFNKTISPFN